MASTNFTDTVTLTAASWFNDVDRTVYSYLTGVAGTNTITATGSVTATLTAGNVFRWIPAGTNTGATTLNITPSGGSALGAKNLFSAGVACTGGETVLNVPAMAMYDGTQFNLFNSQLAAGTPGWTKVVNWTVAGAAATQPIVFTAAAYASAKRIRVEFVAGAVSVDDSVLLLRTSTDGGATYDSGAGNYQWVFSNKRGAAADSSAGSSADTRIQMSINAGATIGIGNAAAEGFSGSVILQNPTNATMNKAIRFEIEYMDNAATSLISMIKGIGYRIATTDIDAIQFLENSGGNVSFTYAVYIEK